METTELSKLLDALSTTWLSTPDQLTHLPAGVNIPAERPTELPPRAEETRDRTVIGVPDTNRTGEALPRRLPSGIESLLTAPPRSVTSPSVISSQASAAAGAAQSPLETAVKTAGMLTGVGPVVTSLLKLFGGGGEQPLTPVTAYNLPSQVALEAGVSTDRSFAAASYGQGGVLRSLGTGTPQSTPTKTEIHVNVQAMDSRSFLDHSDDIARAVREAMLRSHSLNDVIAEI